MIRCQASTTIFRAVATIAVGKPRRALMRWKNARSGPGARLADQAASTSTPRTWARPALLIRPCTGAEFPDWRTFGFNPT